MALILALLPLAAAVACLAVLAGTALKLRQARGTEAATPPEAPAVSVLKPLKGIDDGLLENLESFFCQDHPAFELIFCADSPGDPALRVARRAMERHPHVAARIVTGGSPDGLNPKVANLRPAAAVALHPLVLVSDSNVRVGPGYLREAASRFDDPSVGLVTHLVRGVGERSLGAMLENGHLNAFVLPSVAALDRFLGRPLVVGKSMMLRREALAAAGGFEAVKDVLAEDYLLGELVRGRGYRVVVSAVPVDTVSHYRSPRQFLARHSRWGRMRRSIAPFATAAEIVPNPFLFSLAGALLSGGTEGSLWLLAASAAFRVAVDYGCGHLLGVPSLKVALLGPARELLAAGMWAASRLPGTVEWRGRVLRIGSGSILVPAEEGCGAAPYGREEAGRAA